MRKDGVLYAAAPTGELLPVIEVTNPAFAMDGSPQAIEQMRVEWAELQKRRQRMPKFLMNMLIRSAVKQSLILRGRVKSNETVLDSLSTYVFKAGARNLPPRYQNKFDKQLVSSPAGRAMSLRVQQVAELLARGLRESLVARPDAPL